MKCKLCGYGLSDDCEYDVSSVYVRYCVCTQAANWAGCRCRGHESRTGGKTSET